MPPSRTEPRPGMSRFSNPLRKNLGRIVSARDMLNRSNPRVEKKTSLKLSTAPHGSGIWRQNRPEQGSEINFRNLRTNVDADNATQTAGGMNEMIPPSRTKRAQPSDNRTAGTNICDKYTKTWDPSE